jgi:anti-sigma B factor antagonist
MSPPHPFLRIAGEHQRDAYVVRIVGELDHAGCPDLDVALEAAEQTQAGQIIIDLEQLTFIDSIGIRTLLQASRRAASNGNRLQLTRGKGHPAKMFRLTGLDEVLPFTDPSLCPAVHDAVHEPGARRQGRRNAGARWMPDDANQPRTGEAFIAAPTAWR